MKESQMSPRGFVLAYENANGGFFCEVHRRENGRATGRVATARVDGRELIATHFTDQTTKAERVIINKSLAAHNAARLEGRI